jgi:hypothetical protein
LFFVLPPVLVGILFIIFDLAAKKTEKQHS